MGVQERSTDIAGSIVTASRVIKSRTIMNVCEL